MKTYQFWVGLVLLSSCSAPRYTYYFDHQYPSTKVQSITATPQVILAPEQEYLFTSNDRVVAVTFSTKHLRTSRSRQVVSQEPRLHPAEVTGEPKATFPHLAKSGSTGMEPDLKRSIIFGIAGIVALIIGGQVFWVLGSLSLLIGLIFGVKWILRQ